MEIIEKLSLQVNGQLRFANVPQEMPLLFVLRENWGLMGTKLSCGMGVCGACTVLVDGEPVRSCITKAASVQGKAVLTVEGACRSGTLRAVQSAWIREQVPQCGYCQPGAILAASALLERHPEPTGDQIHDAVGNICRCGTYPRMLRAIRLASITLRDGRTEGQEDWEQPAETLPAPEGSPEEVERLGFGSILAVKAPTPGSEGTGIEEESILFSDWVRIHRDGHITVAVPRTEVGQGIQTALGMLIAEELEIAFEKTRIVALHPTEEFRSYANYALGFESARQLTRTRLTRWVGRKLFEAIPLTLTGGSTSLADGWLRLRGIAASLRVRLIRAAALRWSVAESECSVENGCVVHGPSGKKVEYWEVAAAAGKLPHPKNISLKSPDRFKVLGKSVPRLDIPSKVDGSAVFGIDLRMPDMLYAAVMHAPVGEDRFPAIEEASLSNPPGVLKVTHLGGSVAAIADSFWCAQLALNRIEEASGLRKGSGLSTDLLREQMLAALTSGRTRTITKKGKAIPVLKRADRVLEATYDAPLLAHACMEPVNATALYSDGRLTLWGASQAPFSMRLTGKRAAREKSVKLKGDVLTSVTRAGGSFGLRGEMEIFREAALLAIEFEGRAVQVIWPRKEDIRRDVYRSHAVCRIRASLGRGDLPEAWHYRVVAQPLIRSLMERAFSVSFDFDRLTKYRFLVEGADELEYGIPNQRIEVVPFHSRIPIGFWRSNGHSFNAFFKEGFLDECALAVEADPLQYRRDLLRGNPRWMKILDLLEQNAQWDRPLRTGQGRGVALHRSYGTFVGQVAEATVDTSGALSVDRVVCVVDCGTVVHPDTVRAQIEGAIIFVLSAVLYGEITIESGEVVQSNFHDYRMVRLSHSPEIDIILVPSDAAPTGAGEPAVPASFGAVSNAISAAAGKRVRSLPVTKLGLTVR